MPQPRQATGFAAQPCTVVAKPTLPRDCHLLLLAQPFVKAHTGQR